MRWERAVREYNSIRARMMRERQGEELKLLIRLDAAEKITGLKDNRQAVKALLEYREFLSEPNPILELPPNWREVFKLGMGFPDSMDEALCELLRRYYPDYVRYRHWLAQQDSKEN